MADAADVAAKYQRRRVKVPMNGVGLERDVKDVSRRSGRYRLVNGKWVQREDAPVVPHRERADWARHLKRHDELKRQVAAGEYMR